MKTFGEHFKLINESTLQGNYNTGQAIDPSRQRLDQKRNEFAKIKKMDLNPSNFLSQQTSLQSNYGRFK
jgi:hypothetical protein|tara:strand:+ start:103 stop:309 length:207 start_codon:yes stop_codon:yes gene_type:complete